MSPQQFHNLDESEQAEVIWEGKHIGDRQAEQHMILLYKINDLYVEVYLHKQYNVIRKFAAFKEHELLDIYLPKN